ncbi:MAG: hypothetical protein CL943_04110 [Candidatus Diapherotrites archaeon]|uniref:Uncharacterized protein n=1 Tax=Candidatus Iainarchaeum sp. TaxID=3101447 RepID=A0A2D6M236_9ARCH|nr:hypothetical protein [Candidatus Diapherotrites archaeon]|tara:strand:+ start:1182 stop:1487 length:306 start_codon:yes stop_codon:yes gene_type:complete
MPFPWFKRKKPKSGAHSTKKKKPGPAAAPAKGSLAYFHTQYPHPETAVAVWLGTHKIGGLSTRDFSKTRNVAKAFMETKQPVTEEALRNFALNYKPEQRKG